MNNVRLEIRLLPMSQEEFENKTILEVQKEYFLNNLIFEQDGRFYYPKIGMNTSNGSLILFQYKSNIIASATLKGTEDFTDNPVEGKYSKAYVFEKDSIAVFEPIAKEEIILIDNTFKSFNQSKQVIDYKYINEIMTLINKKSMLWEEYNSTTSIAKYIGKEGAVKWGIQSFYERDTKARNECIKHYGAICQVCGFDFELVYGEMGKGFIHVHHKDKLANKKQAHTVDPTRDLMPVCPNCHAMLHNTYYGYEINDEKLKEIIKEKKESVNI